MLAPTWGQGSFLPIADKLIQILINNRFKVILQPHPNSFYSEKHLIEKIIYNYGNNPLFTLSRNNRITDYNIEIMISDWSGIAFEFALSVLKPVIFVNTMQKIINPNWKKYVEYKGIENIYRDKIGIVINSEKELIKAIENICSNKQYYYKSIIDTRNNLLYNTGCASRIAYETVKEILNTNIE